MGGLKITLKSTGQTITAKLDTDDEDCFICKDPFIFRKALIKIAQTDGKKLAEKEIYESKTFSSEVYPMTLFSLKTGEEIKIEGNFPNYEENKGVYNKTMKLLGGLNVKEFDSYMEVYEKRASKEKNIPYKAKIFIKEEAYFHISSVEVIEGRVTYTDKDSNLIRFSNNINQYVAILSFQNKEDLNLIWETYYSEVRKQMIDSIINDYMKKKFKK